MPFLHYSKAPKSPVKFILLTNIYSLCIISAIFLSTGFISEKRQIKIPVSWRLIPVKEKNNKQRKCVEFIGNWCAGKSKLRKGVEFTAVTGGCTSKNNDQGWWRRRLEWDHSWWSRARWRRREAHRASERPSAPSGPSSQP